MYHLCETGDTERFINTLIHELNHLMDKKLVKHSLAIEDIQLCFHVRQEGIARFSEFVYGKNMRNIVNDYVYQVSQDKGQWDLFVKDRLFTYNVGSYMCFVIFFGMFNNHMRSDKKDDPQKISSNSGIRITLFDKTRLGVLITTRYYANYFKIVLRFLRSIDYLTFFKLYKQYANQAGIKLKYLDEFVKEGIQSK
jgi:hypothetical protein